MTQEHKSQATIEFTFTMVLVVLLLVGMIKVFLWTGNDLSNRWQKVHEQELLNPMELLNPPEYIAPLPINAAARSDIFGAN